jgi:hypothetical protein
MTASPHDRIVTPDTNPDRFSEREAEAFRLGVCGQGGYGALGSDWCGRPSRPGASFGNCDEHDAAMLVDHWPDGTPRWHDDPAYDTRPDYATRLQASLNAHHRACTSRGCPCQEDSAG